MARIPINIDGRQVELREYTDGDEDIVTIDDRFYRVHHTPEGKRYFMVKVRGQSRSVLGTRDQIHAAIAGVHLAFKSYEKAIQKHKDVAQRSRDDVINSIIEELQR